MTTSHNVSVAEVLSSLLVFFAQPTYPRQSQRAGRSRRTLRTLPSTPLPGWSPASRSECSGRRYRYKKKL